MSVVVIAGGESCGSLFWKLGGFFSPTSRHVLCNNHRRGMLLQPALKSTFGFADDCSNPAHACPFCPGGRLHGKYSQYRSQRKLSDALELLEAELQIDEKGLRETILEDVVLAAENEGDAYRDNHNAAKAVALAIKELSRIAVADGETEHGKQPHLLLFYQIVTPQAIELVRKSWAQSDNPTKSEVPA